MKTLIETSVELSQSMMLYHGSVCALVEKVVVQDKRLYWDELRTLDAFRQHFVPKDNTPEAVLEACVIASINSFLNRLLRPSWKRGVLVIALIDPCLLRFDIGCDGYAFGGC